MTSSRERILASLNKKENVSPSRKRSSDEAFPLSCIENGSSKRRTVDSFQVPHVKSKSIFATKATDKTAVKKQTSMKKFYGEKENTSTKQPKLKIFDESKKEKSKKTKTDEALDLMCAEEPTEKYWELLAEERRKGLEIALKENRELAEEIREKDEIIQDLQAEVEELTETAKHAEYLASVLEELSKDCDILPSNSDAEAELLAEGESHGSDSGDEVFHEKEVSVSCLSESASLNKEAESGGGKEKAQLEHSPNEAEEKCSLRDADSPQSETLTSFSRDSSCPSP